MSSRIRDQREYDKKDESGPIAHRKEEANVRAETGKSNIRESSEHRVVRLLECRNAGTYEGHEVSEVSAATDESSFREIKYNAAFTT